MEIIIQPDNVHIPGSIVDLASYRRWARSSDFPVRSRISYFAGTLLVDLGKETLKHNKARGKISSVLTLLVDETRGDEFLHDRMLLTHVAAELSTEPDGMFISAEAQRTGRVRLEHGAASIEVEGSPDMVLEVISPTSVQKDTVLLKTLYWDAEISEYWLVDPRGLAVQFDILRHTAKGYVATRKQQGWIKSTVFDKFFRLTRRDNDQGHPAFTLEVR